MSMETALRARLRDDTAVSAITPRIDWSVRPQPTNLPAVVMAMIADQYDQHFKGIAGYRPTRVQIDCYGLTRASVVQLRKSVISAIVPSATKSGVHFLRSFVNTVLDRGEQTETRFIHRDLIDLTIWHND